MTQQPQRRPFPVRGFVIALAIIVLLMCLPVVSGLTAHAIADAAGCRIVMGSALPCSVMGLDWGGVLYGMDYANYLIVLTIPIFGVVLGIWLVWLAIALLRYYLGARA